MFEVLPGFRDFYPEDCLKRNFIFRQWSNWAKRFDFAEYDIPTLEPLDLLTRKSGEEITSQLFHFVDQGGRAVALRPELTTSLARMVGSKVNSLKRPVKWFNIAENFRYERQQKGRLRSHYQFNADIFGEPGVNADAEVMALALSVLKDFGFRPGLLKLRLSDRKLWLLFLQSLGYTDDTALGILSIIDKMERLPREALVDKLTPFFNEAVDDFLASVEALKLQRDLAGLRAVMNRLVPTSELKVQANQRLDEWQQLLDTLQALGITDFLRIDLGIVRGLAYYTGFVFEIFLVDDTGTTTGRALCGGGRFDHLVGLLGYPDIPAVGFGMGDVTLLDALEENNLMPPLIDAPDFFCVSGGNDERLAAVEDATLLRSAGYRVAYPLKSIGFGKQFKLAGQSGASFALIYGAEELQAGVVKVRDLKTGGEKQIPRTRLINPIQDIISNGIGIQ